MAGGLSAASMSSSSYNGAGGAAGEAGADGAACGLTEDSRRWAEEGLAVDGEEVEGKHSHPELLLLAHAILVAASGEALNHCCLLHLRRAYLRSLHPHVRSSGDHAKMAISTVCGDDSMVAVP